MISPNHAVPSVVVLVALLSIAGAGVAHAAPSNDDFGSARVISVVPFEDSMSTAGATDESTEPRPSCLPSDLSSASVWYSYTPSPNSVITVDTTNSKYDTVLALYVGSTLETITEIACNDDPDGMVRQARLSAAVGTETVFIQISGYNAATGLLHLRLAAALAPRNDLFASAEEITQLPYLARHSNAQASTESGEPDVCLPPIRSVWFRLPPADTRIEISVQSHGFLAGFVVYRGTALHDLDFVDCFSHPATGTIAAEASETYYVAVVSLEDAGGDFDLSVQLSVPPANDDFANAIAVQVGTRHTTSTRSATMEAHEPRAGCGDIGRTVWYRFSPTAPAAVVASAQGSTFGTTLAVFTGSQLGSLSLLGCGRESGVADGARFGFIAEPGQTYYVQIGGYSGRWGDLHFRLEYGGSSEHGGAGYDGRRADVHVRPEAGLPLFVGGEAQYGPNEGGRYRFCVVEYIVIGLRYCL